MALVDLISREVVKVPLASRTKPDVIRELVQVLKDAGRIPETEPAVDAVMAREGLCSTGLEMGVAVPHAKSPIVKKLTLAVGISPGGIDFDATDGKPSRIFLLMLAPPDQSGPHIEALAEIARMARSHSFLNLLSSARSAQEVVDLFREE